MWTVENAMVYTGIILIVTDIACTNLIGLRILKDRSRLLSDIPMKDSTVHDCLHIVHILVSNWSVMEKWQNGRY